MPMTRQAGAVSVAQGLHSVGTWINRVKPQGEGAAPETPPHALCWGQNCSIPLPKVVGTHPALLQKQETTAERVKNRRWLTHGEGNGKSSDLEKWSAITSFTQCLLV